MSLTKSSSGDQTRVQSLSSELEETKQQAEQSSQEHLAQLEALQGMSMSTVNCNLRSFLLGVRTNTSGSLMCVKFLTPPSLPPSLPLSLPPRSPSAGDGPTYYSCTRAFRATGGERRGASQVNNTKWGDLGVIEQALDFTVVYYLTITGADGQYLGHP